jgi:predicted Zn-dependent protease with MMP-like domain
VQYTYQDAATEQTASALGSEALAALPEELRKELADAVISLDIARIADVIGHISERDTALGRTLCQYAEKYAYSAVLHALRSSEAVRT